MRFYTVVTAFEKDGWVYDSLATMAENNVDSRNAFQVFVVVSFGETRFKYESSEVFETTVYPLAQREMCKMNCNMLNDMIIDSPIHVSYYSTIKGIRYMCVSARTLEVMYMSKDIEDLYDFIHSPVARKG